MDGQLSFVTGLSWKHSKNYEAGEEVVLDTTPPEPSFHPTTTVLPPTMSGEPVVRGMYVEKKDLGHTCRECRRPFTTIGEPLTERRGARISNRYHAECFSGFADPRSQVRRGLGEH